MVIYIRKSGNTGASFRNDEKNSEKYLNKMEAGVC